MGRPGTGLIWPWTQCQRTGRWKGGRGCHPSSLRTEVSCLCAEPQCLSWHGLSGRKVWGHCGGWACQGAHTGTTGWGTSPGILQARGSCSPGLLAVGRPVPRRGPIAPSEHGKGTPRGHGRSPCLLGPSVRASLRSHLVEEAWDGHLCPRGSLSGREGRAEAPPAGSTPPCRPSGPTNVPLSRKWTPQVLGAVVPGQVHGGHRVPLCCPPGRGLEHSGGQALARAWSPHSGRVGPAVSLRGQLISEWAEAEMTGLALRPGAGPACWLGAPASGGPSPTSTRLLRRYERRRQGRDAHGHLRGGQGLPDLRGEAGGGARRWREGTRPRPAVVTGGWLTRGPEGGEGDVEA